MKVPAEVAESSISAVITRASGKVENLGVVSYYSRNPLKRFIWQIQRRLGVKVTDKKAMNNGR